MDNINILGVSINNLSMDEAEEIATNYLNGNETHTIFTPNSEIVINAYENEEFKKIINSADIRTADGIGLIHASKILKTPLKERVAGFDLVMRLLSKLPNIEKSVYFFGGAPGVAIEAKDKLLEKYPGINICGTENGYFNKEKEEEIIKDINNKNPDLLLVCLGSPKQEKWIYEHKNSLSCRLIMGVGGTLDVISGRVLRAPDIYIKLGLEWFYRLIKQPSRIGRMMSLPKFLLTVIFNKGDKEND